MNRTTRQITRPIASLLLALTTSLSAEYYEMLSLKPYLSVGSETIYCIDFAPDGKTWLEGKDDRIELRSVQTGKVIRTFEDYGEYYDNVTYSLNGTAVTAAGNSLTRWKILTGKEDTVFEALYAGGSDRWDEGTCGDEQCIDGMFSTGGDYFRYRPLNDTRPVIHLSTGKRGSLDFRLKKNRMIGDTLELSYAKVWTNGALWCNPIDVAKGVYLAFSPDGQIRLSAVNNQLSLEIPVDYNPCDEYDTLADTTLSDPIYAAVYSPKGKEFALGFDNRFEIWDVKSFKTVLRIPVKGCVSELNYSADGSRLQVVADNKLVMIWDVKSQRWVVQHDRSAGVGEYVYSPDGSAILCSRYDGTLDLLSTKDGARLFRAVPREEPISALAVSADNRFCAVGQEDGTVQIYDTKSGKEIRRFFCKTGAVTSISLSPHGKNIIMGTARGAIHYSSVENGKNIRTSGAFHGASIRSVKFSHDGKTFAAASGWAIHHFSSFDGSLIRTIPAGARKVWFSSDDNLILALDSARIEASMDQSSSIVPNAVTAYDGISGKVIRTDEYKKGIFFDGDRPLFNGVIRGVPMKKQVDLWQVGSWPISDESISPQGDQIAVVQSGVLKLYRIDGMTKSPTKKPNRTIPHGVIDDTVRTVFREFSVSRPDKYSITDLSINQIRFSESNGSIYSVESGRICSPKKDTSDFGYISTGSPFVKIVKHSIGSKREEILSFFRDTVPAISLSKNSFSVLSDKELKVRSLNNGRLISSYYFMNDSIAPNRFSFGLKKNLPEKRRISITPNVWYNDRWVFLSEDHSRVGMVSGKDEVKSGKIYQTGSDKELFTFSNNDHFQFSHDGSQLFFGNRDLGGAIWSEKEVVTLRGLRQVSYDSTLFSSRGNLLLCSESHTTLVFNARTGEIKFRCARGMTPAFSPDETFLAAGTAAVSYPYHYSESATDTAATPSDEFPCEGDTCGESSSLAIWNLETNREQTRIEQFGITQSLFFPDSRYLITGQNDGSVTLWNSQSGVKVRTFKGNRRAVTRLAVSSDGKMIAAGTDCGKIVVWETGFSVKKR